jgi:hypothetical protein
MPMTLPEALQAILDSMSEQEKRERLFVAEIVGIMQDIEDTALHKKLLDALLRLSGYNPNVIRAENG